MRVVVEFGWFLWVVHQNIPFRSGMIVGKTAPMLSVETTGTVAGWSALSTTVREYTASGSGQCACPDAVDQKPGNRLFFHSIRPGARA